MSRTLSDLRTDTLTRLGDEDEGVWSADEIDGYLRAGYLSLAQEARVFWDIHYVESLPAHFSVTQTWELGELDDLSGGFSFGVANYTYDDERLLLDDEDDRLGPAWYTCPAEAALLDAVSASTAIPATTNLPDQIAELDRLTWNDRTIDAVTSRDQRNRDPRYETIAGDVYGYTWQQDGVRALRTIRVPAQVGDTYTVTGAWGVLRDPSDLSTEDVTPAGTSGNGFSVTALWEPPYLLTPTASLGVATYTSSFEATEVLRAWTVVIGPCFYTAAWEVTTGCVSRLGLTITVSQQWGVPRQISGQHPLGSEAFGSLRRCYQDGMNVRVEHWRQGRPMDDATDVCELPTRYANYLRDFALWQALQRPSAGQDLILAAHYKERWTREVDRITKRTRRVETERLIVLGGPIAARRVPPTWPYGSVLR